MNYTVYVLCNPMRTLFFIGITGGFTDGIFDPDEDNPLRVSLWVNCNVLIHRKTYRDLANAMDHMGVLQFQIERWTFHEIEKKNRRWKDLSKHWLNPRQLLSFQAIRNSYYCMAN